MPNIIFAVANGLLALVDAVVIWAGCQPGFDPALFKSLVIAFDAVFLPVMMINFFYSLKKKETAITGLSAVLWFCFFIPLIFPAVILPSFLFGFDLLVLCFSVFMATWLTFPKKS
jgi:hypothetical protein